MNAVHTISLIVAVLGGVTLWVGAVTSILRRAKGGTAAFWIALTLVLPVLGPIGWFSVGRGHTVRSVAGRAR